MVQLTTTGMAGSRTVQSVTPGHESEILMESTVSDHHVFPIVTKTLSIFCVLVGMFLLVSTMTFGDEVSLPEPAGTEAPQSAPPPGVVIRTEVDHNTITLGDIFTYSLIIETPAELEVALPGWAANLGQFEIRDYQVKTEEPSPGMIIRRSDYHISIYDTGTFTIPPVAVLYGPKGSSEEEKAVLFSDTVDITVESVAEPEATDIRSLKSQALIPPDYMMLYLIGGGLILLFLLIGGFVYYYKKYRRAQDGVELVPLGPPHVMAYQELEKLVQSDLRQKGEIKSFYLELSEIIRRYIGRRFQIYTLERTTEEIQAELDELYLNTKDYSLVLEFLQNTDLVKFAKYIPEDDEIDTDVERAYLIIDRTKLEMNSHSIIQSPETEKQSSENTQEVDSAHESATGKEDDARGDETKVSDYKSEHYASEKGEEQR